MKMKDLQTKLVAIIVAIVIVSLGALGSLSYWKARQLLLTSVEDSTLALATNSAEQVGLWLSGYKAEVLMLAHTPVIASGDVKQIIPFLSALHQDNKGYLSITFTQPDGTFYTHGRGRMKKS